MKNNFTIWRTHAVCPRAVMASALLLTGCATTNNVDLTEPPAPEPITEPEPNPIRYEATGTAFLEEAGQLSHITPLNGASFIEAAGMGFPAENASTGFQEELTALRAARYGALAEMAEILEGLQVTRSARVQDMVFSGEEVTVTLSSIIQGATTVKEDYDPELERAEVRLRIALDHEGNVIQQRATRIAPMSLYKRKAEAEAAARINAAAALREQVGKSYVMQHIEVEDLQFEGQQTQLDLEGLLENVEFSQPRWVGETQCEVTATLEIIPMKKTECEEKEVCLPNTQPDE